MSGEPSPAPAKPTEAELKTNIVARASASLVIVVSPELGRFIDCFDEFPSPFSVAGRYVPPGSLANHMNSPVITKCRTRM